MNHDMIHKYDRSHPSAIIFSSSYILQSSYFLIFKIRMEAV